MAITVQIAGALANRAVFAINQTGPTASPRCILLNLAGGVATAAAAYVGE
jgi:hypothetical protein